MQKSDAENAIYESARNRKYGKPRLYKQVTMCVVCCLVLICIRLRLQWRKLRLYHLPYHHN